MRLFNRICKVTIYRPDGRPIEGPSQGTPPASKDSGFKETLANGLEIIGGDKANQLRISFEVEKSGGKDPNTATVSIYNLSEHTRGLLKQNPLTCVIDAGHDGIARLLAIGTIKYADSKMAETTRETKIELADGGRAFTHAQVSRSYKAGTPVRTILSDVASTMGVTLPTNLDENRALDARIPRGTTLDGWTRDELTRMLAPYGLNWSCQNGQLQVLGDTETRSGTERIISVKEAGLVESPQYGTPDKKTKQRTLTFKTLLYPELMPGTRVRMDSEDVKGPHKLVKIKHTGDTRGNNWYTECEARPL